MKRAPVLGFAAAAVARPPASDDLSPLELAGEWKIVNKIFVVEKR